MFKKIILLVFIFSPIWYSLFIGFPVISDEQHRLKQKERPTISISKRCFDVGNFNLFRECFSRSEELKGIRFVSEVTEKLNQISPIVTFLFFVSLSLFLIASVILIWLILE